MAPGGYADPKPASVNRRLREELSPVRPTSRDRSRSPASSTSSRDAPARHYRDRPRSPYASSRANKRRWDDDSRGPYRSRHTPHPPRGYHDSRHAYDQGYRNVKTHGDYDSKRDLHQSTRDSRLAKRPRRESRSPPRFKEDRSLNDKGLGEQGRGSYARSHNGSVSSGYQDSRAGEQRTVEDAANVDQHADKSASSLAGADAAANPGNSAENDDPANDDQPAVQVELSAEERRQRREALRAKLRSQTTDLHAQSAQPSAPQTPHLDPPLTNSASQATTPKASPWSPSDSGAPGSPAAAEVGGDTGLFNASAAASPDGKMEETSAADFDPTLDKREERMLQGQRDGATSMPAQSYNEKKVEQGATIGTDVDVVGGPGEKAQGHASTKDDMFASDDDGDDDDMFAVEDSAKAQPRRTKDIDMSNLESSDDPDGYYKHVLGETLDGRYKIVGSPGKGMYATVVSALDQTTGEAMAIKINRNNTEMVKTAQREMAVLRKLAEADPNDIKHIVRFHRSFTHRGHLCLVFEYLEMNLRETLQRFGRDRGLHLSSVRAYAYQMFQALGLLRKCDLIHADLKPDNMLVRGEKQPDNLLARSEQQKWLKICDLGSAVEPAQCAHADLLASRFYRAPEVILGYPYDFNTDLWTLGPAMDMWSVGCTLYELYTGKILFGGRDNNQMLRVMMETRGKFNVKMLKKSKDGLAYFDNNTLAFRSVERDQVTNRNVVKLRDFQQPTWSLKDRLLKASPKTMGDAERKELMAFLDLLERCLALNPDKRITPGDALKHPFIVQKPLASAGR